MKKVGAAKLLVGSFFSLILIGTVLLSLPGATAGGVRAPLLTALFTATSAVCVTGLVVVDTATYWSPFGQVVVMLLFQLGGLGLMVFATLLAVFLGKKIGLQERIILQQSLNQVKLQGIVKMIIFMLVITFTIEAFGAILLTFRWLDLLGWPQALYYGIFHAISAFNNAGFDLFGSVSGQFSSLTASQTDPLVNMLIAGMFVLGGLGFTVILDLAGHRRFNKLSLHSKMVITVTGVLAAAGILGIYLLEYSNPATLQGLAPGAKFMTAFFQGLTPRTAGFSTVDIGILRNATQFLIIMLMFIGASPGSTGGGVKTVTFAIILLAVRSALLGRQEVGAFKKRIPAYIVGKALAVAVLAVAWIFGATLVLATTEQADFLPILFETVSAFGTVGLSMGLTPDLSPWGQAVIILTMFIGRVGPLTLAYAIAANAGQAHQVRYPEEKLIIG